jgi:three-Cys-motif partner protein
MANRVWSAKRDGLRARPGGAWTREKLVYLRKYASAFMTAMAPKRDAGKWDALVFIDLLAGPGIDIERRSRDEFSGSPLIALEVRPAFDYLFLGDLSERNVAVLRRRIPDSDRARVDLKPGDCHERADAITRSLSRRTLGFAFVDPEGFEVRFDLLRTLATRRIDILMLFPSGIGILRNLRSFARQQHSAMDDLWGSRAWRQTPIARLLAGEPLLPSEAERLDLSWAFAFRERVATIGYTNHDSVGPLRNEQNVPMYHLLFFSRDPAGLTIWRNVTQIEASGQRRIRWDR